jgi:hypothetical protein
MSRIAIKVPAFNGVAVGQPAQSNLNVGPGFSYNHIFGRLLKNGALVTLANLATDVSEIRLEADGDVIRRITPALLLDYLQSKSLTGMLANGAATDIASFVIPFVDPSRADVVGQESTRLGTVGVKQLLLVVVLNDPGGAPVYALTATADITTDEPKSLSVYERWAIDNFDLINGVKPFNTLATDDDILGYLIHANTITHATVTISTADGRDVKVFDLDKAELEIFLRTNGLGGATANYFPLMADFSSQITDRWVTALRDPKDPTRVISRISGFTVELTATAAASVKALRRTLKY